MESERRYRSCRLLNQSIRSGPVASTRWRGQWLPFTMDKAGPAVILTRPECVKEINKGLEVLSAIVRNASFDCAKLCDSGTVGPSDDARRVLWILPAADAFSFGRSITKKAECVIVALSRRLALKIVPTLRQPAIHHSVVQPQIDAFNWQNLRHGMLSKSWTIDRLQDDAKHKMIRFVRLYFR